MPNTPKGFKFVDDMPASVCCEVILHSMVARARLISVLPPELILACLYVHVSASRIPLSLSVSDTLIAHALRSFAIHGSHPFIVHASHSFIVCASHSFIVHISARLHLFMRCILSLFSCISHSAWSLVRG